ncbi:MAG: nickel pincer cofactor biosynthesis protein LarC [Nitrospiraceae bacterium]|nr:nickel pincer cofactor biosynthesis protein LarC [Nitrospiraceae bacterium]
MKTLYFDCACGASGDMIAGALIDAGVDFEALSEAVYSLDVSGFRVRAEKVDKRGIAATQFSVDVDEAKQPRRHLKHVLEIIARGDLPEPVKAASEKTFRRLAECEARVHGTTIEQVHFHEVGAVDSIVDVVAAHWALNTLGVENVVSSALNVGSGTVNTAHGVLPVPAPATAALIQDVPSYGSGVELELLTPTGAALVTQLASSYGAMPRMRVAASGYGSGQRELPDRANVLRVLLGEAEGSVRGTQPVTVIEFDIDDMNPELFPPLVEDLLRAGARDAFLTPVVGKKGRPAYLVTVLCDAANVAAVAPVVFDSSTTFGMRMREEQRICLEREWKTVDTAWGCVRIKVGRFDGRVTCMSPEFEDCRRLADESGVPVLAVYEAARAAAARREPAHD